MGYAMVTLFSFFLLFFHTIYSKQSFHSIPPFNLILTILLIDMHYFIAFLQNRPGVQMLPTKFVQEDAILLKITFLMLWYKKKTAGETKSHKREVSQRHHHYYCYIVPARETQVKPYTACKHRSGSNSCWLCDYHLSLCEML